jgi:nanoRNase/pAp phosphatase (c-di-AMP/oligoRNAs hydrolase)
MRNPWREFQSAPLGKIFAGIGGGGHERVGAYIVPKERAEEAEKILDQILDAIRKYERVGDFEISSKEVASRV